MVGKYKCSRCGKEKTHYSWQKLCYGCQCEQCKEEFESNLIESGEKEIHCPWCGATYDITDETGLYEEGENPLFCQICGKGFTAKTDLIHGFSTRK